MLLYYHRTLITILMNSDGAVVRQKSAVSVLYWNNTENNSVQMSNIFSAFDKKHQFVSVAVPEGSLEKFTTVSNTGVLKLWDIEYAK